MKARLSIEVADGVQMNADGAILLETPGLSEDLRLLRGVLKAHRDGVERFPGQQTIAPLLAGLLDKPLQVFTVGGIKPSAAEPAPFDEDHPFELAKPAEGVAAAVAAIRALNGDL